MSNLGFCVRSNYKRLCGLTEDIRSRTFERPWGLPQDLSPVSYRGGGPTLPQSTVYTHMNTQKMNAHTWPVLCLQ